jgi:cytochrome c oxidase subunit 4
VLIALTALTVATVAISFVPLAGRWHLAAGMAIGLAKASLVALFFMHLVHSPRLIKIVVAVAVFWLFILSSLTFCDYLTRGSGP